MALAFMGWMARARARAAMVGLAIAACGGDDGAGDGVAQTGDVDDGATASGASSQDDGATSAGDDGGSGSASAEGGTSDDAGATSDATATADDGAGTTGTDCDCMLGAYFPVCGVDGTTYDATCGLECVRPEILCLGECPCPEQPCGDRMSCAPETPVCTALHGGPAGSRTSYDCGPLPEGCTFPGACETCFPATKGCDCSQTAEGYFLIECYAP